MGAGFHLCPVPFRVGYNSIHHCAERRAGKWQLRAIAQRRAAGRQLWVLGSVQGCGQDALFHLSLLSGLLGGSD